MNPRTLLFGLVLLSLFSLSWASTTCEVKDCKITITIKIAFAGADDAYIQRAKTEIEDVWNGPNGQSHGDCKCPVSFKVETIKTADCVNNPPAGYHCITVTDFNNNPPRNQTNWTGATFYIGYMFGIASGNGGNSQSGWWSNIMSRPVNPNDPGGEHYKDFAHEGGHMMGLSDSDSNLMNTTSGANAVVTQGLVDKAVEKVCGANACPDRCCCGNGVIDRNKNEQCDPMVGGCPSDEYCCPVCCQCYGRVCFPENGEYAGQENCQASCGPNAKCYYNYQTGCWDCLVQIVVGETIYDPSKVQQIVAEIHAARDAELDAIRNLYENGLLAFPTMKDFLGSERANIIIEGKTSYYALTDRGEMYEVAPGVVEDPTVVITTDIGTLDEIDAGLLSPLAAYKEGRIKIEGIGFFNALKFWFAGMMVDNFAPVDAVPNLEPREAPEQPAEPAVDSEIDEIREPVPPKGGEFPEGEIPETVLIVEMEIASEFYFEGTEVYNG
ncbi:hypothetical protein H0O02_03430 [Candidatus Micrarchaeota archaeon]|nr:hypothetical protein [Candidatus Micrarchaeota archaeon]